MVPNVGSNRLSGTPHRGDLGALCGPVRSLHQHHDLCIIALCIVADTTGSKYPRFRSKKQNNLDLGPTSGPARSCCYYLSYLSLSSSSSQQVVVNSLGQISLISMTEFLVSSLVSL